MSVPTQAVQPGRPAIAAPSDRVRLARLALEAALAVDGVVSSDAGPLGRRVTDDRGERLRGVRATALAGGRYGVDLHLVTEIVPLPALADRVRSQVERAAASAGLAELLGPVGITIEDVVISGEAASER